MNIGFIMNYSTFRVGASNSTGRNARPTLFRISISELAFRENRADPAYHEAPISRRAAGRGVYAVRQLSCRVSRPCEWALLSGIRSWGLRFQSGPGAGRPGFAASRPL